jgi:hypothetical protein
MMPSKSTIQLIFVILTFFITPSHAQNKIKLIAESDSSRYYLNYDNLYKTWANHTPRGTISGITIKGYGTSAGDDGFVVVTSKCKDQTIQIGDGAFTSPKKGSIALALLTAICNE